jgi:hypothetical protein
MGVQERSGSLESRLVGRLVVLGALKAFLELVSGRQIGSLATWFCTFPLTSAFCIFPLM